MAALNKLCLMTFIVACASLMVKTGVSQVAEPAESPEVEVELELESESAYAEAPEIEYMHYLSDCAEKLSNKCGDQIYFGTFYGNATVDHDCCLKLVNVMGKRCHNDLIKFAVESPKFERNVTQITLKSKQIWNDCASSALAAPQPAQQV
ncbi:hypothetical protein L6164_036363 [Bauhinia variegata]|uniref:Uncharacterized protein n=1 Tax=Bauhinia variegata TaxID=167791 RepID=A0ACB9KGW4_BAUVA|nr:hypothetical protein L6164_036363 [Bauhinia variegata]